MYFNQIYFNFRILIISLSSFLLLPILHGQQIKHVEGKNYQYEGQIYKYSEMDHVFRQNEFSYVEFQKTIRKRKTSTTLGLISLGGISTFFIYGFSSSDGLDKFVTILYITGGISVLAGTTAIIVKSGSKKSERKSVDIFNEQRAVPNNDAAASLSAELGLLSNGRVGVVFSF